MDWQDIKVSGISISLKSTTLANDFRKGRSINTHTLSGIRWITGEKLLPFGHLVRGVDSLEKTLMLGGLGAGGEGDDRGWDGWMASPIRWMWVWVNSGSWWWTGRPGMLQFMGSQRVIHDWTTQLNWTELNINGGSVVLYNNCSSRKCCWIIDWLEFMVEVSIFLNTKTEYKESEAILIGWKCRWIT